MINKQNSSNLEITPEDFEQWITDARDFTLMDIRKPWERDMVKLEDDLHVPISTIGDYIDSLRGINEPLVIYCHHGIRSLKAAKLLQEEGIKDVLSLAGGIDAWAREIDDSLPTY